jgi:acylphosphatase
MLAQIRIYGRVQGVWFLAWTGATARTHKFDGWVRNFADGSVEALFQADADKPHITASGFHILADG